MRKNGVRYKQMYISKVNDTPKSGVITFIFSEIKMASKAKLELKDLEVKTFQTAKKTEELKGGATFIGPNCNTDGQCFTPYF